MFVQCLLAFTLEKKMTFSVIYGADIWKILACIFLQAWVVFLRFNLCVNDSIVADFKLSAKKTYHRVVFAWPVFPIVLFVMWMFSRLGGGGCGIPIIMWLVMRMVPVVTSILMVPVAGVLWARVCVPVTLWYYGLTPPRGPVHCQPVGHHHEQPDQHQPSPCHLAHVSHALNPHKTDTETLQNEKVNKITAALSSPLPLTVDSGQVKVQNTVWSSKS